MYICICIYIYIYVQVVQEAVTKYMSQKDHSPDALRELQLLVDRERLVVPSTIRSAAKAKRPPNQKRYQPTSPRTGHMKELCDFDYLCSGPAHKKRACGERGGAGASASAGAGTAGSAAEPTDEPTAEGSAIAIGKKRSTVTIAKKLKVLDFYESMSGGVCARGAVALAKFPETLRCKGQLARWRQAS